jgi:acyl carrier protein
MDNKLKKLKKIFQKVISKKNISDNLFLKLKMNDIKEWDSMQNMHLLIAIEKGFKKKFSFKEMNELNSINKIIKKI